MSNLPISSPYRSTPQVPVKDDQREDLSARLNEAFTAGEINQDDYLDLQDKLYRARNLGELVPVVERLPVKQTYAQPDIVVQSNKLDAGQLSTPTSGLKIGLWALIGAGVLVVLIGIVALLLL